MNLRVFFLCNLIYCIYSFKINSFLSKTGKLNAKLSVTNENMNQNNIFKNFLPLLTTTTATVATSFPFITNAVDFSSGDSISSISITDPITTITTTGTAVLEEIERDSLNIGNTMSQLGSVANNQEVSLSNPLIVTIFLILIVLYAVDNIQSIALLRTEVQKSKDKYNEALNFYEEKKNLKENQAFNIEQQLASTNQRLQACTPSIINFKKNINDEPIRHASNMETISSKIEYLSERRKAIDNTTKEQIEQMSSSMLQLDEILNKIEFYKNEKNIIVDKITSLIINEKLLNQGMMNMMCYNNIPYILEYISSENNGDLASLRNEVSQYDLDVLRDILSSINEHLVNLNEEFTQVETSYNNSVPLLEMYDQYSSSLINKVNVMRSELSSLETKRSLLLDTFDRKDVTFNKTNKNNFLKNNKKLINDLQTANEDLKRRLLSSDERLWEVQITMQKRLDEAKSIAKELNAQLKMQ